MHPSGEERAEAPLRKAAEIIRPKFKIVISALERDLSGTGIAHWTNPKGGYFISLYLENGTAKRTYDLCLGAGVHLTTAGATYPYGIDPDDSNIRIAPSLPPVAELKEAIAVLCICLRLAAVEKLLAD